MCNDPPMNEKVGGVASTLRRRTLQATGVCLVLGAAFSAPAIAAMPPVRSARRHGRSHPTNPYTGRFLPAGTPYAAEVRANITGTVHFEEHDHVDTHSVCDAGVDQIVNENETYDLRWGVSFNQVTVPIATAAELGRAARRLHLRATPTSNGINRGSTGTWSVSGTGPTTSDGCDSVPYSASGTLAFEGRPVIVRAIVEQGNPFEEHAVYGFQMPPTVEASPDSWPDTYGEQEVSVQTFLGSIENIPSVRATRGQITAGHDADWNFLAAEFETGGQLVRLRTHSAVTLPPITNDGTTLTQCPASITSDFQDSTCNGKYSMNYKVTLMRHALYRTKRAYRRR